jgi:hypothetical protein
VVVLAILWSVATWPFCFWYFNSQGQATWDKRHVIAQISVTGVQHKTPARKTKPQAICTSFGSSRGFHMNMNTGHHAPLVQGSECSSYPDSSVSAILLLASCHFARYNRVAGRQPAAHGECLPRHNVQAPVRLPTPLTPCTHSTFIAYDIRA